MSDGLESEVKILCQSIDCIIIVIIIIIIIIIIAVVVVTIIIIIMINIYAEADLKYIYNAGRQLFTRRETGIKVSQQSWNKLATKVAI